MSSVIVEITVSNAVQLDYVEPQKMKQLADIQDTFISTGEVPTSYIWEVMGDPCQVISIEPEPFDCFAEAIHDPADLAEATRRSMKCPFPKEDW